MNLMQRGDLLHAHAMNLELDGAHHGAGEVYQEAAIAYRAAALHIEPLEGKADLCIRHARRCMSAHSFGVSVEGVIIALAGGYLAAHLIVFALMANEIGLLAALGVMRP